MDVQLNDSFSEDLHDQRKTLRTKQIAREKVRRKAHTRNTDHGTHNSAPTDRHKVQ